MTRKRNIGSVAATGGLFAAIALLTGPPAASADELADLRANQELLQKRIDQLSQAPPQAAPYVPGFGPETHKEVGGTPVVGGSFPRSFLIPGTDTSLRIGGFANARFSTPAGRAANATERILLMAEIIKERPTAEWLQQLDANDVPSAPVLRRNEVIANEQVVARELIIELDHPDIGRVRQPVPAARFERTPARIQGPAPRVGEDSAAILAELGFGSAEIDQL